MKKNFAILSTITGALGLLALSQSSQAAVTITVFNNGTGVTWIMSGTINRAGDPRASSMGNRAIQSSATSSSIRSLGVNVSPGGPVTSYSHFGAGQSSGVQVFLGEADGSVSSFNPVRGTLGIGLGGGFSPASLTWDVSLGNDPAVARYNRTWTTPGETVASLFGTNLDSGPVVLWTHRRNGDTFAIQVPEPSSALLSGLGVITILARRRR